MDEQTLSIILECPVCLNTFSESARVLPCQHTFCLECLEDIIAKRGCLHCPECRALVTLPIGELPRNILLMRLLSGIQSRRNSAIDLLSIGFSAQPGFFLGNLQSPDASKSCPTTPGLTASSFPLFFPQTHRKSLPAEEAQHLSLLTADQRSADQRYLSRSPSDLQQRLRSGSTSSVSQDGTGPSTGSGMRTSRTTVDLASLGGRSNGSFTETASFPAEFTSSQPNDLVLRIPVFSSIDSPSSRVTVPPAPRVPVFSLSSWNVSPRTSTNPSGDSSDAPSAQHYAVTRSLSNSAEEQNPSALFIRRVSRAHVGDAGAKSSSGLPGQSFSSQRTSPPQSNSAVFRAQQRSVPPPPVHNEAPPPPKEAKSFIKQFFRGHKTHDNSHDGKFKSSGSSHIDGLSGYGNEKSRGACLTSIRSTSRHNKGVNFECYRCVVPYPARNQYELDLRLNDLLYVHQKHSDGWLKATHERTGRNGLIPTAFVERLHSGSTVA